MPVDATIAEARLAHMLLEQAKNLAHAGKIEDSLRISTEMDLQRRCWCQLPAIFTQSRK
jgi:hypothetical protein